MRVCKIINQPLRGRNKKNKTMKTIKTIKTINHPSLGETKIKLFGDDTAEILGDNVLNPVLGVHPTEFYNPAERIKKLRMKYAGKSWTTYRRASAPARRKLGLVRKYRKLP